MNTKIINIALSQVGIKEVSGTQDNPEVLKYFNELGFDGAALKDETAWCSAFVNWVAKEANLQYSKKLNARSWLEVGTEVTKPEKGDVVVFWRDSKKSWKGHVAFFIRETQNWIYVLGGNQNNQVKISAYPKNRLLGYRRL
ncbi:TIGR02594 family protein [Polaribacter sp. MSW13]|uniref:TIGR02594 family protein n=1 Tax=Polaribacter marinus TaxID=2916838 RepID=A0A9X1VN43_9FLAO|nr:TIGR02594 family protein [Polaribacter marinus]MCI2229579.1 TIGR02594 family protein [Polaribacter marinus]